MRLWSIHPRYLDPKGLVALWREALLAKKVLEGCTVGYKNHPQLIRFKGHPNPLSIINLYLKEVYEEANRRGYNFDRNKFKEFTDVPLLSVTEGQLDYERNHLLRKLKLRDSQLYQELRFLSRLEANSLFSIKIGGKATWER